MHLAAILDRTVALAPDRVAVTCKSTSLTYAQLGARVRRLAGALRQAGLEPGMAFAIVSPNCHVYLEAYLAAAAAGLTLVPINTRLAPPEIAFVLEDSGARLVLCDQRSLAAVAAAGGVVPVLALGEAYESALAAAPATRPPRSLGGDEMAHLYYTSGTTGRPKGVILTHSNVFTHALAAVAELGLSESDVWAHIAPLFHLADAWATFAITMVGGRHVLVDRFEPAAVLSTLRAEAVTTTNLVPTMLAALVGELAVIAAPFPHLRRMLSGGAPIAPELVRRILATFGCDYVQTYGMTETSPYLTMSLLDRRQQALPAEERLACQARTGRPFLAVELQVVREDGSPVTADDREVGEIRVRGPTVTPGYWKQPEATAAAFDSGGWLRTGDLATIDSTGSVAIVDRKKDMIITGGENVYSIEVEHALASHPAVQEVAVYGCPDARWGETVHAAVVLRPGATTSTAELVAHCKERIAGYKAPRAITFLDALPRTGSGKVHKLALRATAGGSSASDATPPR